MTDTEIIICTEKGNLEGMSKLLVWTIRNFGGRFNNTPIFSYQPRKGLKISRKTVDFFNKYEVEIVDEVLNKEFIHYPLANKPLATAQRELQTRVKNLVFLDSDIFFLKEPVNLLNFDGSDVILRPVDHKNIGIENAEDENSLYWKKLYNLLDVKTERKVRTTSDHTEILEYYNSGHLVTRTEANLFNQWKENFIKVMRHNLKPADGNFFYVEQSTFSATVSQMQLNVKLLEDDLNHPIFFIQKHSSDVMADKYKNLTSIHYHKEFKNKNGKDLIEALLNSSENGRMIQKKISEFGLADHSKDFTSFLNRQIRRFYRFRYLLNTKMD